MKKLLALGTMTLAMASAFAEPSWALLTTDAATGDVSEGAAISRYTAYLCTVEAAKTYFGGYETYADIANYLGGSDANYLAGMGALQSGGTALTAYGYDMGEYSFTSYFQPGALAGDYIAVVAYAGDESGLFRVFGSTALDDTLAFSSASAGEWKVTTAVPEPTGGLLILLGAAGLALRRKRA